jgi:peptidylprolyl isomerase
MTDAAHWLFANLRGLTSGRLAAAALFAVMFAIAGCSADSDFSNDPSQAGPARAPGQSPIRDPENTIYLTLKSGIVTIKLRPDLAPGHATRIKQLTREGFYNGVKWHRVIEGFMAQTGDPTGTGQGGSKYPNLKAEFSKLPFTRGIVGMARATSEDSGNSQFFIMLEDNNSLNEKYTVIGEVIDGMKYVDRIARGEPPAAPDLVIKMQVVSDTRR